LLLMMMSILNKKSQARSNYQLKVQNTAHLLPKLLKSPQPSRTKFCTAKHPSPTLNHTNHHASRLRWLPPRPNFRQASRSRSTIPLISFQPSRFQALTRHNRVIESSRNSTRPTSIHGHSPRLPGKEFLKSELSMCSLSTTGPYVSFVLTGSV